MAYLVLALASLEPYASMLLETMKGLMACWKWSVFGNLGWSMRYHVQRGNEKKYIEERLNHRPRKSLGWRTPYEVFHEKEAA